MKAITALEIVRFGQGVRLKLDADQAKTRSHNLKKIDGDVYETINHVEFKRGEKFGFDGELTRAMEQAMEIDGVAPLPKAVAFEDRKPKPAAKKGKR